jgi:serine phosphatase RsbU (regulator of sigma subunit)
MQILEKILNTGIQNREDVHEVRLVRQVNGLNLFYTLVAASVAVISFSFLSDSRGAIYLGFLQAAASLLYMMNIFLVKTGKLEKARYLTVHFFEWHLFMVMFLTNGWSSSVLLVVVLYPLLAALTEISIFRHLAIGMFQVFFYLTIHSVFPDVEYQILQFSSISPFTNQMFRIMGLVYFPVMGAVIISIIYRENVRARRKQKEMLNQIQISNRQLEVYANALKDETQRLKAEVEIAKQIQTMVLPTKEEIAEIQELDIATTMRTAEEVGGDYFDVIKLGGRIIFGIGDVTGHGLPSGIIMLMVQSVLRTMAELGMVDLKQVLTILNRVLFSNIQRMGEERNMTLQVGYYEKGKFNLAGQHESVLIWRKNGEIEILDTLKWGFYVGMMQDIEETIQTKEIRLEKGETLFLYTDGVTEAVNADEEQFGLNRVCETLKKYAPLPAEKIKFYFLKELYNFIGAEPIYDDISFMVIKQK